MSDNSSQFAIRFGESVDKGLEPQQAFPFIYTFVPTDKDTWEIDRLTNNLSGIGPAIPPGVTLLHQVRLDADCNFLMLWIKYTVYWLDPRTGTYVWYEPVTGYGGQWFLDPGDYQTVIGTPLTNSILASVWMQGPDSRTLYGGQATTMLAANAYVGKVPVPLSTLQGYDFGYGQVRTPYFLPANGMMMFELTNTHTIKTLVVGAIIYGLKVRI